MHFNIQDTLEYPFGAKARSCEELVSICEVIGEFNLATDIEVIAAEVTADVIPDLRLRDEDGDVLPPYIGKS